MDIVTPEEITTQHLEDYWSIFVVDDKGKHKKIWESRPILPFVPDGHPGTPVPSLYVRVPSLDDVDVQATVEHLRKTDKCSFDRIVDYPTQANAG